uniref:Uncharacterized protein n=1 Tax=viral metagenome TaxID=1070528 RepID=A0A6M3IKJ4_9ZZZZ
MVSMMQPPEPVYMDPIGSALGGFMGGQQSALAQKKDRREEKELAIKLMKPIALELGGINLSNKDADGNIDFSYIKDKISNIVRKFKDFGVPDGMYEGMKNAIESKDIDAVKNQIDTWARLGGVEKKEAKTFEEKWLQSHPNATEEEMIAIQEEFAKAKRAPEVGAHKIGATDTFKIGEELVNAEYIGGKYKEKNLPKGWKSVSTAPRHKPETNIDIAVDTGLTKSSQTKLQEKIMESQYSLDRLEEAEAIFEPEFLKYSGQGKAWVSKKLEKGGVGFEKEFLGRYSKWKNTVETFMLEWRKYITGVAGGEKEMKDIEKATINTKYDSETTFKSKLSQIKKMTTAAGDRAKFLLENFNMDIKNSDESTKKRFRKAYPLKDFYDTKSEISDEAADFLKNKGLK